MSEQLTKSPEIDESGRLKRVAEKIKNVFKGQRERQQPVARTPEATEQAPKPRLSAGEALGTEMGRQYDHVVKRMAESLSDEKAQALQDRAEKVVERTARQIQQGFLTPEQADRRIGTTKFVLGKFADAISRGERHQMTILGAQKSPELAERQSTLPNYNYEPTSNVIVVDPESLSDIYEVMGGERPSETSESDRIMGRNKGDKRTYRLPETQTELGNISETWELRDVDYSRDGIRQPENRSGGKVPAEVHAVYFTPDQTLALQPAPAPQSHAESPFL